VQEFHQLESNLQVCQFLADTRRQSFLGTLKDCVVGGLLWPGFYFEAAMLLFSWDFFCWELLRFLNVCLERFTWVKYSVYMSDKEKPYFHNFLICTS